MNTYCIYENGSGHFATVEARNGESAIRKAARKHERRACDYSSVPGTIRWVACNKYDELDTVYADVNYPGRGDKKVSF